MSIPLNGTFVPTLMIDGRNPSLWSTLSATFTDETTFSFETLFTPNNFTAPTSGSFTLTISVFDGKSCSNYKTLCWTMTSEPITVGATTATLAATSNFKATTNSSISGTINITKVSNTAVDFSIQGALASVVAISGGNLGQIPVTVQITLTPSSGSPITWFSSSSSTVLTGYFNVSGNGITLVGGAGISPITYDPNNMCFTISNFPHPPSGAQTFTGTVQLSSISNPTLILDIAFSGNVQSTGNLIGSINQRGSTFIGYSFKGGSFHGSLQQGNYVLSIENAQFVLDPSGNVSPMVGDITGSMSVTYS